MHTYQMIAVADENGKTYTSKYGLYNKHNGFALSNLSSSMIKEELLDNLFHEDCWSLKVETKKMTKDQIEKELGYKIEIIDEPKNNDKSEKIEDKNKSTINSQLDDLIKAFDDVFYRRGGICCDM